ncbi:MAG: DUF2752 domain-containing protein [Flavobacteriales bacterium]|nr:DUF2752 domain-containing protein [Flavobacteriales bacterium]|tara:strand:- start:19 stop:435 length:417 start_codon:yes stop_codon:yes gene_type:complete
MTLNRNKLYWILFTACTVGYVWIYFISEKQFTENNQINGCLIKHFTNIPCPSCGSSRSVISLLNGDFIVALNFNPIGYIIVLTMLVAPVWIIMDTITKTNSLFNFYLKTENYLKKLKVAIPLILIIIMNWIWNITKGL